MTDSIGTILRGEREARGMSLAEISKITRIPTAALESLETDRYDELPGEVFIRGFVRAYAQAVGADTDEVMARYSASRRIVYETPLPSQARIEVATPRSRRFGFAIAFVVLLILLTVALSVVFKPRGNDLPHRLSRGPSPVALPADAV